MLYIWISSFILFLFYLIIESMVLTKRRESIPLRITVTGIRGKTSVVRLLTSVLRQEGKTVVAKTTGAKPCLLRSDGTEEILKRKGSPSILEQKKLIKTACKEHAQVIVSEIMSIHAENHYIESQRLLKPHMVVLTNIRLDHTEALGNTKEDISRVFCFDIPEKATVFIPENEKNPEFLHCIHQKNCKYIKVDHNQSEFFSNNIKKIPYYIYPQDVDIVHSVCSHLNIQEKSIKKGILQVSADSGALKVWKYKKNNKSIFLVHGFGANDPESTLNTIKKIKNILPAAQKKITGLLCLRKDRGDRTLQWVTFLKNNQVQIFNKLFVSGGHSRYVKRKFKKATLLRTKNPELITDQIITGLEPNTVVLGLGNFKGTGNRLVDYWDKIGENIL